MLKPTEGRVLVKVLESPKKTPNGIHLPDTADKAKCRGRVLEIGPPRQLESGKFVESMLKVGDIVVFGAFSGFKIDEAIVGEADLLIVNDQEVIGVIK